MVRDQRTKTIPIDQVDKPFVCPIHGETLARTVRKVVSTKTGRVQQDEERNGGIYFGCPKYAECGYYVNGRMTCVADVGQEKKGTKAA